MAAPSADICRSESQNKLCEIEFTVVTGFEVEAKDEIKEKFGRFKSETQRGKVIAHLPVDCITKILELKSIDNAFVVLRHYPSFVFKEKLEDAIQQIKDLVPELDWKLGLEVWSQFFHFPYPISAEPQAQVKKSADLQDEGCVHSGSAADPVASVTQDAINVAETTPSSHAESLTNVGRQDELGSKPVSAALDAMTLETVAPSGAGSAADEAPQPAKELKAVADPTLPRFRATCYRSGPKHVFQSPQAAAGFGGALQDHFGWNVDLSNHDIEVVLTVETDHVYVSIALTRSSLHRRNLTKFGPTSLKPTIAYNMLRMCKIQPGEVVCDPMCGGGSIPIEGALNWPSAAHLCGDNYDDAPPRTLENVAGVNAARELAGSKGIAVSVMQWDATRLPLRDESVDVFVSDLPFGKRSGSKLQNWRIYPGVLQDLARVSRRHTGRACLLTLDKKCFLRSLQAVESLWRRGPTVSINIGGLAACVYLLHRTGRQYLNIAEMKALRARRGGGGGEAGAPDCPSPPSPSGDPPLTV